MMSCRRCPVIGLTGPTGAGKGVVSGICRRWGIPSIDTDAVYHALLEPPSAWTGWLRLLAREFATRTEH